MNLGELLEELREGILHDRSDLVSGENDYLWPDTRLIRYIDQAQRRFARGGLVIRDGTTPLVTQVTLSAPTADPAPGQNVYPLDPSVLAVVSAQLVGDTADLARAGHVAFQTYHMPDPYYFNPSQLSTIPAGKPLAFGTDEYITADPYGSMGVVNFRVFPPPINDYNGQIINLRVIRMPLVRLTVNTVLTMVPEVPEEHHMDMLDWAAYLALRKVDIDAGMPERANEFRQSFEAHVLEARKVAMRKMFTPLQWGFGRNGFSWDRDGGF